MNTVDYDIDKPSPPRSNVPATVLSGTATFVPVDLQNYKPIPNSFLRGLRDFKAGKVVKIDKALNEKPPIEQE